MSREIQINPMRVRTMQIVAFALVAGVLMFLVVALIQTKGKQPGEPFLAYFGAGFAALMIVLRFVVPDIVAQTQLRQLAAEFDINNDENHRSFVDRCAGIYQTKMIIGTAFLEGAAFLNVIEYMSVVQTWSLAVVGVLVAIMLITFPSEAKITSWIRQQLDSRGFEN